MMMELGQHQQPFSTSPEHASTSNNSSIELTTINAEELANILLSESFDCIVLDCRPPGTLPTIRCAHPIFLPTVLLRRLNNGTISPTSISPLLCDSERKVIIVPDSMQPNSLAGRVFNTLVRRQFTVAFLNEEVKILADLNPELCNEENVTVNVMKGLNLNILNMCDVIGKKIAATNNVIAAAAAPSSEAIANIDSDENRHRRPIALFPVQILPYLYLGNVEIAKNKETLKRYNIKYVINVTSNLPNFFKDDIEFNYLRIAVDDTCSHNLIEHFPTAISFIERAREEKCAVLVHCLAGISRSVTICLAYLMQATHSTLDQAFDFLRKQNGAIAPNFHFMGQLSEFERNLFDSTGGSNNTSSLPPSSTTSANSMGLSSASYSST